MIELEGVGYAPEGASPTLVDLSLRLSPGEKAVLLGPNGSGKSTLLKILDGLIFPGQGEYRYRGERVDRARFADRAWSRRFRGAVALLFQDPNVMLFNPTVRDEIAYGPRQIGMPDAEDRARRWAQALGIAALLDKPPFMLSGGEKQKVCLAALLALEPELLLLDEPAAHLDPRSTGWLVELLDELPATVLVSTHNLSLAPELGRRCLILGEDHRLWFDGAMEAAFADTELLLAANLVHRHRHRHGVTVHTHPHVHDWT